MKFGFGASDADATDKRPCTLCGLEMVYLIGIPLAVWMSSADMWLYPAVNFTLVALVVLTVTRLGWALSWLLLSAGCIGFLIFVPMGAMFQFSRFAGSDMAYLRFALIMFMGTATLVLLWMPSTTRWLRARGGRFANVLL